MGSFKAAKFSRSDFVIYSMAPITMVLLSVTGFTNFSWQNILSPWLLISLLVIYPVCEELIFRGVIQNELLKTKLFKTTFLSLSAANIFTSAVFLLAHIFYFQDIKASLVFIPSLAIGFVYEKTMAKGNEMGNPKNPIKKRLANAFVLHAWFNLNGVLFTRLW